MNQWETSGIPDLPRAWISRTPRYKAIDRLRRRTRLTEKLKWYAASGLIPSSEESTYDSDKIEDDRLRLIFTCCHPVRSTFIRDYSYRGSLPQVKQQIKEMALNGSGTCDTAQVLKISRTTVTEALKKDRHLKSFNWAHLVQLKPTQTMVHCCQFSLS